MEPVTVFTICDFFTNYAERLKKAIKSYEGNRDKSFQVNKEGYFLGNVQASMKKKITKYRYKLKIKKLQAPAGIKTPVNESDRKWMREKLDSLERFTGMGWILSPEPQQENHMKTFDYIVATTEFTAADDKVSHLLTHMAVSEKEKAEVQKATVGQRFNPLWFSYKKNRLTASNFGAVISAIKRGSTPPSLLKLLKGEYQSAERAAAIQWGIIHEQTALSTYRSLTGNMVTPAGLFIMGGGQLGASPDGILSSKHILEIKCPWSVRKTSFSQLAATNQHF